MSKNTRILATVLPRTNPNPDQKGTLHVSLSLSPQLFMRGHSIKLGRDYYEVHHWPQYAALFEQSQRFRLIAFNSDWTLVEGNFYVEGECTNPLADQLRALQLWQQMLPTNSPVSHWQESALPYELAEVFTRDKVRRRVDQALSDSLNKYTEQAGFETGSGRRQVRFRDLIRSLQGLSLEELLAHPAVKLHHRYLGPLYQELQKIASDYRQELDSLLLRLDLTEVYERNVSETSEFHKRFSAYAQYPELLRQTGWLWDYSIKTGQSCGPNGEPLLQVIEQWKDKFVFITLDQTRFELSDAVNPGEKDYGIFANSTVSNPQGEFYSYLDLLIQQASTGPATGKGFWLGLLNELDFLCPLTAVEWSEQGEDCNAPQQSRTQWRVGRKTKRLSSSLASALTINADSDTSLNEKLFEQFREYVRVNNADVGFRVHSRLVDRKQLFQRIEDIVLQVNTSTGPDGRAVGLPLQRDATQRWSGPFSQSDGYTANGITLVISNLSGILQAAIQSNPAQQSEQLKSGVEKQPADVRKRIADTLQNSALIYQHNVHNGYRVDVIACNPEHGEEHFFAGSLCTKREHYLTAKKPATQVLGYKDVEGWLSEPAQMRNDGKLAVDEELFHWNDWNLVTPMPGAKNPTEDELADAELQVEASVGRNSQVPLRLLWRYSFALRPVDICGNSAPPITERLAEYNDWGHAKKHFCAFLNRKPIPEVTPCPQVHEIFTEPVTYKRVNGVHQPRIFLYERNPRTWDVPARRGRQGSDQHEHLTTFVIRSFAEQNAACKPILRAEEVDDVRLLAPPRISLRLLMQHGLLDKFLNTRDEKRRGKIMADLLNRDAVAWQEDGQAAVRRLDDHDKIDYLFDPLVDGFEILLDHNVFRVPLGYADPEPSDRFWRGKRYHRLCLRAVDSNAFQPSSLQLAHAVTRSGRAPKETVFLLKKGFTHEISLGCLLRQEFGQQPTGNVFLEGITKVYFSPLSHPPTWDLASRKLGDLPAENAPVTFIHAVEKPCLLYASYSDRQPVISTKKVAEALRLEAPQNMVVHKYAWAVAQGTEDFRLCIASQYILVAERAPQSKTQHLSVQFAEFPVLTAGTFHLHSYTVSVVSDRSQPQGYRIQYDQRQAQSALQPARRGVGPADPERERNVTFEKLKHTLPDTRFCRVAYEIEAVSKYSEYFRDRSPKNKSRANSISGYITETFDQLIDISNQVDLSLEQLTNTYHDDHNVKFLSVLSSAKPEEPIIEKIVPLLKWNAPSPNQRDEYTTSVERRCDSVRIYFSGDWYSTGWGEQVAVFFRVEQAMELPVIEPGNSAPLDSANQEVANYRWGAEFSSRNSVRFTQKKTSYHEQSLSQLISQFGSDPIATIIPVGDTIDQDFFITEDSEKRSVKIRDLEWEKPPYADAKDDLTDQLGEVELNYVVYKVKFASCDALNKMAGYNGREAYAYQEGKFYVDIPFNPECIKPYYFPFLRFAIARYQPNSIRPMLNASKLEERSDRYCFSKVVMTDFFQPLPYRKLLLEQKGTSELEIRWPVDQNPTKQLKNSTGKSNRLVCFVNQEVEDSIAAAPLYAIPSPEHGQEVYVQIFQQDLPSSLVKTPGALQQPPPLLLNNLPKTKSVITIAEYEYHENDELSAVGSEGQDPRTEPRRRLIFSYVLTWPMTNNTAN
ncbi:hypothetical protein [Hymenobacter sp. YC55]|uniref:hypothetical protein n=1 Tax=Hymenobacter sp. YC55 TaxID=3034019 RepID=UPI0023F90A55|nr:hypothetical protein [Hymenobacter sp. YC55]MDF7815732.1 hypothetical protein [Hymenobacter sp. YC55]